MRKTSENSVFKVELLSGNIFHVMVKERAVIGLESAKHLIQTTNGMLDDDNPFRGGVYDISGIDRIDDDARNYLSRNADVKGTVIGIALISNTFRGKMVGNLFITLGGAKNHPVQFFECSSSAEHWVRKRLKEAIDSRVSNKKMVRSTEYMPANGPPNKSNFLS